MLADGEIYDEEFGLTFCNNRAYDNTPFHRVDIREASLDIVGILQYRFPVLPEGFRSVLKACS